VSVVAIDDGFDFHVVVLDDTWVVRVPRRPSCAEALAVEAALLPALAPALPVQVPQFEVAYPFAVYRAIRGTPLVDEEDEVREFLEALHAFDVGELPVPHPDWRETYRAQCDEFRRLVLPSLDVGERKRADDLFAEVETLVGFVPALTHSDLGPEHLLCRDGRLAGVIDWGDARVGDPALDYAWLLNGPFPHWEVDDELRRRARFYHRLAPWFGAHFDVFRGRAPALDAVRARLELSSRP
jgi:aminoglycoside phosphotransferase (APT) family kinase protein